MICEWIPARYQRRIRRALRDCAQGIAEDGWNHGFKWISPPVFKAGFLGIDESITDRWGGVSASAAAKGKPGPVIDVLLATTALHHNLTLVTRNTWMSRQLVYRP